VRWGNLFKGVADSVRRHLTRLAMLGTLSAVRRRGFIRRDYRFSGFWPLGTSISKPFNTIEIVE
jgi:hypothetical protein